MRWDRRLKRGIGRVMSATHPYRAFFWLLMVPAMILADLHTSVFVIFLYSTYANFAGDIAAWEARD